MIGEFRARIGRIRMKNGGADVRVIDRSAVSPGGEDWRGNIIDCARKSAGLATEDAPLVGFVVVGLYGDGAASVGYRYDLESRTIPRALLPEWIAEIIRRDMIAQPDAREVFNEMFEWRDETL